jgi:hypothetical protein
MDTFGRLGRRSRSDRAIPSTMQVSPKSKAEARSRDRAPDATTVLNVGYAVGCEAKTPFSSRIHCRGDALWVLFPSKVA